MDTSESVSLSSPLRSDSQSDVAVRVLRRAEIAEVGFLIQEIHSQIPEPLG